MGYLRVYALDMAYTEPPRQVEAPRTYKQRMYNTIHEMSMAENSPRDMRVTQLKPSVEWALAWKEPTYDMDVLGSKIRMVHSHTRPSSHK